MVTNTIYETDVINKNFWCLCFRCVIRDHNSNNRFIVFLFLVFLRWRIVKSMCHNSSLMNHHKRFNSRSSRIALTFVKYLTVCVFFIWMYRWNDKKTRMTSNRSSPTYGIRTTTRQWFERTDRLVDQWHNTNTWTTSTTMFTSQSIIVWSTCCLVSMVFSSIVLVKW